MERRVRGNLHARCGAGEKFEVLIPETYLSLLGKIPDFDLKLATFRSLRISADIIVQSVAQLKEMYEDRHGKIMSNCSITILLGANDLDDCKLFSDLIGQTTVRSESVNIDNKGLVQGSSGGSISDNAQMLLRPEQIRSMNKDQCLILVNTSNPIRDNKYVSLNHPRWKESFSDRDPEMAGNEFQYRRLFYIEQKDEYRVSVEGAIAAKEAAAGAAPAGRPTGLPQRNAESSINRSATASNASGVSEEAARESIRRYEEYKKRQAERQSLNEQLTERYRGKTDQNGEIAVKDLDKSARDILVKGVQEGRAEIKDNKVVTKHNTSKGDMLGSLIDVM